MELVGGVVDRIETRGRIFYRDVVQIVAGNIPVYRPLRPPYSKLGCTQFQLPPYIVTARPDW